MKLIKIETKQVRAVPPSISFEKSGCIRISSTAVRLLGLKPGMEINFYFDESEPKDVYFDIKKFGLPLRSYTNTDALFCNCSAVTRKVLSLLGKAKLVSIRISTEPHEGIYAILTKSVL